MTSTSDRVSQRNTIQVAVRVRPLNEKEAAHGSKACVDVTDTSIQLAEKQFDFDAVFDTTAEQENVYSTLVKPLLDEFFSGYNATVFAYGQTGSGKTYTMGNESASNRPSTDRGIVPRVIENIFELVDKLKNSHQVVVKLSYLEILNEEIIDLAVKSPSGMVSLTNTGLSIRGDRDRGIVVTGLSEHVVQSVDQAEAILRAGAQVRATGSTSMNTRSSRSHAICTLKMELHDVSTVEGGTETRFSKLHLVDLAGSERVRRTNSAGVRFKEGVNINRGLLALGNVINALCKRSSTNPLTAHIPYRDSKLTRLLQDSLGGNSKTLMIACISPADVDYEETSTTLRYAFRARNIENRAVINKEIAAESSVAKLKQQLAGVKSQLLQQTRGIPNGPVQSELYNSNSPLEEQNHKLREELQLANSARDEWKRIAGELEAKFEGVMKELQILHEQATKKRAPRKRKARESYETMETLFSSSSDEEDNSEVDSDYVDGMDVYYNRHNKRRKRKQPGDVDRPESVDRDGQN
uniref:Kinesin-like protein n=1 Tax=Peronospora matthiolae TaxID=2874970 RepID=A0AAV1U3M5_9STRA